MGDQGLASKGRPLAGRRSVKLMLTCFLSLLCFGLAVVTLVPWSASIPNHVGYYSVCSFAPISTVMLLVLGLGIRSYGLGRKGRVKSSVVVLVLLVGFSGFWAYAEKTPISSLQLGIQFGGIVSTSLETNSTAAVFNLTIHNPTGVDTPAFEIESSDIVINGTRLVPGTYDFSAVSDVGQGIIVLPYIIGAHQTNSMSNIWLTVYWNKTETEGGTLSTVLSALNQSRFTLTFSGLLVARTAFQTWESGPGLIIAAASFKVSLVYP